MKSLRKVLVDTGFLIAIIKKDDAHHESCMAVLKQIPESCRYYSVESCLAESIFLLSDLGGVPVLKKFIDSLPLEIKALQDADIARVFELLIKYQDQQMDFADAALVALAEHLSIGVILTTDRRDFSIYRPKHIRSFTIIP